MILICVRIDRYHRMLMLQLHEFGDLAPLFGYTISSKKHRTISFE